MCCFEKSLTIDDLIHRDILIAVAGVTRGVVRATAVIDVVVIKNLGIPVRNNTSQSHCMFLMPASSAQATF